MPLEPLLILELATLGLAAGLVAGLLGIGGMLIAPFLTGILTARGVISGYVLAGWSLQGLNGRTLMPA